MLAEYAARINPELDCIVVTNLDRMYDLPEIKVCVAYDTVRGQGESLSDYLWRARPKYDTIRDCEQLLDQIETAYGKSICAVSAAEEDGWRRLHRTGH